MIHTAFTRDFEGKIYSRVAVINQTVATIGQLVAVIYQAVVIVGKPVAVIYQVVAIVGQLLAVIYQVVAIIGKHLNAIATAYFASATSYLQTASKKYIKGGLSLKVPTK